MALDWVIKEGFETEPLGSWPPGWMDDDYGVEGKSTFWLEVRDDGFVQVVSDAYTGTRALQLTKGAEVSGMSAVDLYSFGTRGSGLRFKFMPDATAPINVNMGVWVGWYSDDFALNNTYVDFNIGNSTPPSMQLHTDQEAHTGIPIISGEWLELSVKYGVYTFGYAGGPTILTGPMDGPSSNPSQDEFYAGAFVLYNQGQHDEGYLVVDDLMVLTTVVAPPEVDSVRRRFTSPDAVFVARS